MTDPSAADILREVMRLQDQVTDDRGEALHADQLSAAVRDGIRAAVSDPELWAAATAAIQKKAASEAGGWLFGGLRTIVSRIAWVCVIGMAVYLVGGWGALAALVKGSAHG